MSLRLEHSNPEAVVQAMQRERERERPCCCCRCRIAAWLQKEQGREVM